VARLRENLLVRHVFRPDSFSAVPKNPPIEIVDSIRVIEDGTRRLELYQIGPAAHVDRILIGYLPKERILIEGDLLDVAVIVPIHGSPSSATMQDLERAVAMQRARAKRS
jgi:hypothetical protein